MRARPDRAGAALVLVLLAMVATLGVSQVALLLARAQLRNGSASIRALEDRVAAGHALVDVTSRWPTGFDALPVGGRASDTVAATGRRALRLSHEQWLVEVGSRPGLGAGLLVWMLDPVERVRAFGAAVTAFPGAPLPPLGRVDASALNAVPAGWSAAMCGSTRSAVPSRLSPGSVTVSGTMPADPGGPRLGRHDLAALIGSGVPIDSVVTPNPLRTGGSCRSGPTSWGDPTGTVPGCDGLLPLVGRIGSVVLDGGRGQGILVVDGEARLTGNAHYRGVVLAAGAVRLEDRAVVEGMVVAGGGVHVDSGAVVRASHCAAVTALAHNRALLGPVVVDGPLGPL